MADPNCCPICGVHRRADAADGPCPRCQPGHSPTGESCFPARPSAGAGPDAGLEGDDPQATRAHIPQSVPVDLTGEWLDVQSGPPGTAANLVAPRTLPPGASVRYFGDYEIRRELGRGGMGVVYEARQVSLNRPVALKMIKAGLLADHDEQRRFQNEAEAVALLDHPGIVSAYEVGEHDGQQYLAMKLVKGEGLNCLLDRYLGDPRAAAALVAAAAEAVAHAHSRGILHRDLKPANILVDAEGHPHVTDFGLAKRLESDLEMTASGAILGTPAYMAPEQAGGRRGGITTATDVYGLGSVLYALLTGRPPFGGDTVIETLDALRSQPPEPPMHVNRRVPRDLETICLKCLEKDPRRRYASAQALADDLRCWLDARPIAARRVGLAERTWLWCRRRPAVAALSAVALVAVVGGTGATIGVQANANRALLAKNQELTVAYGREAKVNAELAAANERVEQRYNLAMDAIKTFHTGVSEDFLLKEPRFQSLRDRLLETAGEFYQKLGAVLETSGDTESKRALLASNFELAELDLKLGRREDALALHRRVLAAREALAGQPGASHQLKVEASRSMRALIDLLKQSGHKDEVPPLLTRAVEFNERLAADRPDDPDAQEALVLTLAARGDQLKNVDFKREEAEKVFRRGLAIAQAIARDHPGDAKYLAVQSIPLSYLSYLRYDEGKYEEAIHLYRQVLDLTQQQLDRKPGDVQLRSELAAHQTTMSSWSEAAQHHVEAVEFSRSSVETWRDLVADQPAVSGHRKSLAGSLYSLGLALAQSGRAAEAEPVFREAITVQAELAQENPDLRALRTSLTDFHASLGYVLLELRRPGEAEAEYRETLGLQTELAAADPGDPELRDSIALSHFNLGRTLLARDKVEEAEAAYREAIAILEKLVADRPGIAVYRGRLAMVHRLVGNVYRKSGRLAEAESQYDAAMRHSEALVASSENAQLYRNGLATDLTNSGDIIRDAGRVAEARDRYDRAIAIRERLVEENRESNFFRSHLAWSLRRRGQARLMLGDPAGAESDVRRALGLWDGLPSRSAEEWFETACAHAILAGLSGRKGSGVSGNAAASEIDTAIQLLSKAVEMGYRDAQSIRTETALDRLRDRPELQRLMMDLALPTDPFAL